MSGRAWLAVIGTTVLCACASAHPVMVGRQEANITLPEEPGSLIQMKRDGCPDQPCPVYGISIFPDGSAIYDGRANVGVVGRRATRVSARDLNALISTLDAMDFLDSPDKCCLCGEMTSSSLVTVTYRPGTVAKTVIHDERCATAPAAVSDLERQIDRVTGAGRLAARPDLRSNGHRG